MKEQGQTAAVFSTARGGKPALNHLKNEATPRPAPDTAGEADDSITFRVSVDDKKKIQRKADEAGCSLSEYIRQCALGKKVEPRLPFVDESAISTLKSLCGLLKQVWKSGGDTSNLMFEIREAVRIIHKGRAT
jgi:hypothetical protein